MNWLLWALVAWCKDMKGVDVGYQLLDSIHQARDCARGEEKCHEEEVEAEERLPVPLVQWPWDFDRAIVTPFLGAVMPVEGGARQDESREASGQNVEQAVDSSIEGQGKRQQPDHRQHWGP